MKDVKDLTIDELEHLIEEKILEIIGDPDFGLELREDFQQELRRRLASPSRRTSHDEVLRQIGRDSVD